MALLPTIPTSFVPHPAGPATRRFSTDVTGVFGFFAYMVLVVAFVSALGVFFYNRILVADQVAKDAALAKAEATIDPTTVEGFVRLRNRLNNGGTLFKKHVAFSNFFTSLETLLPATARFSSLHLSLDSSGIPKIEGSGIAKNFNALAAVSTAFAADGHIKDAIFSKISINKDNSVSFELSAKLDQKTITFMPSAPTAVPSTNTI